MGHRERHDRARAPAVREGELAQASAGFSAFTIKTFQLIGRPAVTTSRSSASPVATPRAKEAFERRARMGPHCRPAGAKISSSLAWRKAPAPRLWCTGVRPEDGRPGPLRAQTLGERRGHRLGDLRGRRPFGWRHRPSAKAGGSPNARRESRVDAEDPDQAVEVFAEALPWRRPPSSPSASSGMPSTPEEHAPPEAHGACRRREGAIVKAAKLPPTIVVTVEAGRRQLTIERSLRVVVHV
ncbi:MAG: hypothetical protein R3F21_22860 [Myxococcota bacterium]